MTITPEMIEEVAEWVRAFDDHSDDAAAETLLKRAYDMKMSYAAEFGPDAALASALRTSYHDDGEVHYAKYSSVPGQWLRMAAAARAHVDGEHSQARKSAPSDPRVPRVFHRGDAIPGDVQAVKTPSGKVFPHFPDDGGGFGYPKDGYGFLPHDTAKGWSDSELPLTEVLPEPRTWESAEDIPTGVLFTDAAIPDLGSWIREGLAYRFCPSPGRIGSMWNEGELDGYGPFTEVLS